MKRLSTLTPQQVRVLMMLSDGLMNKQIAYELGYFDDLGNDVGDPILFEDRLEYSMTTGSAAEAGAAFRHARDYGDKLIVLTLTDARFAEAAALLSAEGRSPGSKVQSFCSQASRPPPVRSASSGRAELGVTAKTAFCSKSSVGVLNGRSPVNSS